MANETNDKIEGADRPKDDIAPALEALGLMAVPGMGPTGEQVLTRKERSAAKRELKALMRGSKATRRENAKEVKAQRLAKREATKGIRAQIKERDKASGKVAKRMRAKRDRSSNSASLLGYDLMYADGICQVEEGLYSQTIAFPDISYQSAREDKQRQIFDVLCHLLDYFGSDVTVQFNVINTPILKEEIGSRTFFDEEAQATEAAAADARLFNAILNDKVREGVSNIRRSRLLTYAVKAASVEAAVPVLARIRTDVANMLARIGCTVEVLDGHARLSAMNALLNPGRALDFDYERDVTAATGLTTKEAIAPVSIDFKAGGRDASWYATPGTAHAVLVMRSFGSENNDRMLSALADLPIPINITWHVAPMSKSKAVTYVKQRLGWIDKEIIEEQQRAARKGYDFTILPPELAYSKEEAQAVLDDLQTRNQRLYGFCGLIHTYGSDKAELDGRVRQIIDTAKASSVEVETLDFRQRAAMNSMLPLGCNHIEVARMFTTAETAIFVPFATQELDDEGGNYAGQNASSNNLVMVNRKRLASPVGFIAGKTGSGKSFFVKQECEGTILSNPNDQIIIFDRASEFVPLARHHDGTVIELGADSETYQNPFDLSNLSHRSREAQLAFKIDAMLAQAQASAAEAGVGLPEGEQSIITRAVELAFAEAEKKAKARRKHKPGGGVPLLGDFHRILLDEKLCPEPEARTIALRYERFVGGILGFFNNHSNVDWSGRIIDISFKDLPDSMVVFALINMCEAARNQMYKNFDEGRRTWIYIEEIQSLFQYPTVLNYFSRFANEARKFGGIVTGITQDALAMLDTKEARAIVTNADYIMLLKQSQVNREKWVEILGLSGQESESFDEGVDRGCGLLVAGAAHVPIRGGFPKGNALYDLFSTDPNEAEARAAAERLGGQEL